MTLAMPIGTATNYPYQFGRVFKQGVIANYPQVLIDGVAQTTQADVKNRWPDGSVKFAILSLIVPSLSTSAKTFTFQNQVTVNSTPETKVNMLANYDFNCTINATSGGSAISGAPVAARTLLNAVSDATLASNTSSDSPNSRYWTQGPICTTVILCDHTSKTYDFGTNASKVLRPIFHVQFWPTLAKYKVRVIIEAIDVTKLADQTYDVSLSIGNASPTTFYTRSAVPHCLGSRWTKSAWSGTDPVAINHDHNCEYIASTYAIPRFDIAQKWSESKIATKWSSWNALANKDIYDNGTPENQGYAKSMQAPGGRPEIAIFTEWNVDALLSGDYRLHAISNGLSEMSHAWPSCFREGDNTKKYYDSAALANFATDFSGITFPAAASVSGSAIGCPITLFARPTIVIGDANQYMNSSGSNAADRFAFAPPISAGASIPTNTKDWAAYEDHIPQPYFVPYLISGDYFWHEMMMFWAARAAFDPNIITSASIYARGNSVYGGNLVGSGRRMAWMFRNRVCAAVAAVDGSKEKAYFNYLIEDALQCVEGVAGVTGSGRQSSLSYIWGAGNGRNGRYAPFTSPTPLHSFDIPSSSAEGVPFGYGFDGDIYETAKSNGGINRFQVGSGGAPFQMGYMIVSFSFAKDSGYNIAKLREWCIYYMTEATKNNNTAQLLALLPAPLTNGSFQALGSIGLYKPSNFVTSEINTTSTSGAFYADGAYPLIGLEVGNPITVTGTNTGGSGLAAGTYLISATDGARSFTLTTTAGAAITTVVGTSNNTGLVFAYPQGGYYTSTPSVTVSAPNVPSVAPYLSVTKTQANATANMSATTISSISLTNTPSGYRSPPTIAVIGTGGAKAVPYSGPVIDTSWLANWQAAFDTFVDPTLPKTLADGTASSYYSSNSVFACAAATITDVIDGPQAYNWIKTNWIDTRSAGVLPWASAWSIIPR
jgi:hypothetical protein